MLVIPRAGALRAAAWALIPALDLNLDIPLAVVGAGSAADTRKILLAPIFKTLTGPWLQKYALETEMRADPISVLYPRSTYLLLELLSATLCITVLVGRRVGFRTRALPAG